MTPGRAGGSNLLISTLLLAGTVGCRGLSAPSPPCEAPSHLLANAEAGEELGGRVHWYATVDTVGSTLTQSASPPFVAGGAKGTPRAALLDGNLAPHVDAFTVLGLELDRDAMATIGSRARGFRFWAKNAVPSGVQTRLIVVSSTGDSFAIDVPVYGSWTEYVVPFESLKPSRRNHSSTLDPTRIRRIEWRWLEPAQRFALAIDELEVLGCIPPAPPPVYGPK